MSQVGKFLQSTIGRKVIMALTGLLWVGFLVGHMLGNLQIFINSQAFNEYGHTLTSTPLIYVVEVALAALITFHFVNGLYLVFVKNKGARTQGYANKKPAGHRSRKSLASTSMIATGIVMLVFLPLHIWMFKFGDTVNVAVNGEQIRDLRSLVIDDFSNPAIAIMYMLVMLLIGLHLWHGFNSAFESLGVRYRQSVRRAGQAIAIVTAGGFFIIPLLVLAGVVEKTPPPTTKTKSAEQQEAPATPAQDNDTSTASKP